MYNISLLVNMEIENEEGGGGGGGGGGGRMRRAEIDTRAPFRSVKEAVMLFGERVLAGEVYANKLNQIRAATTIDDATRLGSVVAELEETKQSLEKAREERQLMADYLTSLKEDLEKTKMELRQLKARQQAEKQVLDSSIEQRLKFVGDVTEVDMKLGAKEFQKKRSVKFANPPSLAQVINPEERVLVRQFSVDRDGESIEEKERGRKKKKKKLVPLIAAVFGKKKGYNNEEGSSPKTHGSRTYSH